MKDKNKVKQIYRTPSEVEVRIRRVIAGVQSFDEMIAAIAGYVSHNYVFIKKPKDDNEE